MMSSPGMAFMVANNTGGNPFEAYANAKYHNDQSSRRQNTISSMLGNIEIDPNVQLMLEHGDRGIQDFAIKKLFPQPKQKRILKGADGFNYFEDGQRVLPDLQASNESKFSGSGIESQMLNIMLDDNVQDNDPRKQLARQRLRRSQTISTPQGVYTQPGYDLSIFNNTEPVKNNMQNLPANTITQNNGDLRQSQNALPAFTPARPTERQQNAQLSTENMKRFHNEVLSLENSGSFNPAGAENIGANTPFVGNFLASPDFRQFKTGADEWAANLVFLRSGATARQEEKDSAVKNYFPQPGDDPETIKRKQQRRQEAFEAALKAYASRTGENISEQPIVIDWNDL